MEINGLNRDLTPNPKYKKPRDTRPSPFIAECLEEIISPPKIHSIDIPCGFGRHAILLASMGYEVLCADRNFEALCDISSYFSERIHPVYLDATKALPFKDGSLGIAIIVHYTQPGFISKIAKLLAPGGYLLYETFGGQGRNWEKLPSRGETVSELGKFFKVIKCRERHVGPIQNQKVSVKIFAQML